MFHRWWARACAAVLLGGAALGLTNAVAGTVGVVLMHGLQGEPTRFVGGLASSLRWAGYLVETPEMCWSRRRLFDRALPDCLTEIDAAADKLRHEGATAIVIAGHSLGGTAAIAYGALHPDLLGVIALAPAGDPGAFPPGANAEAIADSVAAAQGMVAKGNGASTAWFKDVNRGQSFNVMTSATIYLSFLGPDALTHLPAEVPKLKVPLLWVAGSQDPTQRNEPAYAYDKVQRNPLNRFVTVDADHLGTPDAASDAVLTWLTDLVPQQQH
jgi:pimeloyl-ACP methyl ester carboxylesterase